MLKNRVVMSRRRRRSSWPVNLKVVLMGLRLLVFFRQFEEGVLQAVVADGEVAGFGCGQEVAGERIGVLGGHAQAVAADVAACHARQPGQVREFARELGADYPAGTHVPQFVGGAVGDDLALFMRTMRWAKFSASS